MGIAVDFYKLVDILPAGQGLATPLLVEGSVWISSVNLEWLQAFEAYGFCL